MSNYLFSGEFAHEMVNILNELFVKLCIFQVDGM